MYGLWKFKMWLSKFKRKEKKSTWAPPTQYDERYDLPLKVDPLERLSGSLVEPTSKPIPNEEDTDMSYMDTLFDRPEQFEDEDNYFEDELDDELEDDYEYAAPTPKRTNGFNVRIDNLCDGAADLAAIADILRAYADFADSMHEDGYVLSSSISGGNGYAYLEEDD